MTTTPEPSNDSTARPAAAADVDVDVDVDVLIVGAGLSGIGAACRLQTDAPGTSYVILEARGATGGTWDLFRYPGIRSDSDMFTLGYPFRPWSEPEAIAGGDAILSYIRDTAAAHDVDRNIRFHQRVESAQWSSERARWTVTVEHTDTGERTSATCRFLYLCSGYYDYEQGHTPSWPGVGDFTGQFVHPQQWPADLDVEGKRVVVIGSGATAVTLVPALVEAGAGHVTMLQRSPSYVMALPTRDPLDDLLRRLLPEHRAYRAIRWKNVRISTAIYQLSRRYPNRIRAMLAKATKKRLPPGYDIATHFTPTYDPWDQRMCMVPEGDLFAAITSGAADVVTDHIDTFTPTGVRVRGGTELDADIIVSATGVNLLPLGGIKLAMDDVALPIPERVAYKGMMLDGVPNLAFAVGYTNASWTLKVDLVSAYVAGLLRRMRQEGIAAVTPRLPEASMPTAPLIDMSSGYFERARHTLPLQGDRAPWRLHQHYAKDAPLFTGPRAHDQLEFTREPAPLQPQR